MELANGDRDSLRAWASQHEDRVRFHAWLQWLLERQLATAGEEVGLAVQRQARAAEADDADGHGGDRNARSAAILAAVPPASSRRADRPRASTGRRPYVPAGGRRPEQRGDDRQ